MKEPGEYKFVRIRVSPISPEEFRWWRIDNAIDAPNHNEMVYPGEEVDIAGIVLITRKFWKPMSRKSTTLGIGFGLEHDLSITIELGLPKREEE